MYRSIFEKSFDENLNQAWNAVHTVNLKVNLFNSSVQC